MKYSIGTGIVICFEKDIQPYFQPCGNFYACLIIDRNRVLKKKATFVTLPHHVLNT